MTDGRMRGRDQTLAPCRGLYSELGSPHTWEPSRAKMQVRSCRKGEPRLGLQPPALGSRTAFYPNLYRDMGTWFLVCYTECREQEGRGWRAGRGTWATLILAPAARTRHVHTQPNNQESAFLRLQTPLREAILPPVGQLVVPIT